MVKKHIAFKGKAVKVDGGWGWEFYVDVLDEDHCHDVFSSVDFYPTKEQALREMKLVIKDAADKLAKKINSPPVTEFINMKTKLREKWDVGREH